MCVLLCRPAETEEQRANVAMPHKVVTLNHWAVLRSLLMVRHARLL